MRLPFTRHIGGRLGWSYAAVVVLLVLGWSVSSSALRTVDTGFTTLISYTDGLSTATFDMTTAMLDQETGARGYVLTSNALFLQPYTAGQSTYPVAYARALALATDATDRRLLGRVQASAQVWQRWAQDQIRAVQSGHRAAVLTIVASGQGKQLFDTFRASSTALLSNLQKERQLALTQSQDTYIRATNGGVLVFWGAIAIVVLLAWRMTRSIVRPLQTLREATTRIRGGYLGEPVLSQGTDEVAELGRDMETMRLYLATRRTLADLLASTLDLESIFPAFAEGVRVLAPFDRLTICTIDEQADDLTISFATGAALAALPAGLRIPLARIFPDRRYRTEREILWADLAALAPAERRPHHEELLAQGFRTVLILPLTSQGRIAGTLNLFRRTANAYDAGIVATLATLVQPLASAMANAHLYAEAARANEDLAQASKIKSDFLANMSHELRTPLNAIIGFSEVLHDESFGALNARQQRYVGNVLDSGRHLLALVNDILDLSKVEAGRMELHLDDLDLSPLLVDVHERMLPLATNKGVDLRIAAEGEAVALRADRARFVQVLYNLLSNAIKFTPSGGTVTIRWLATPATVAVSVQDTGIGIAVEDQQRIFEEFAQVDSSVSRAQEGTGLGLALTRRLVELHGGSLTLESTVGQGSTFTVTLPHVHVEPYAAPTSTSLGDVLVVEDDSAAYELLRITLGEAGYYVHWVQRVADVVPRAREVMPLAITLDIMLHDELGWSALEQLRADQRTRDIPVVIISILDEQAAGFALGASAYLVKPTARLDLLATLSRLIDGHTIEPEGHPLVLAVDDHVEALELIALALDGSPYRLLRASSGAEALEILAREHVDLLLVDLMMSPLSGFDVIDAVVANPKTRDVPIIVLTARALADADMARLNGHVAVTLAKSGFNKDGFLRELRRATRHAPAAGARERG